MKSILNSKENAEKNFKKRIIKTKTIYENTFVDVIAEECRVFQTNWKKCGCGRSFNDSLLFDQKILNSSVFYGTIIA